MVKNRAIPAKYQVWIDARKRYHLSHAQVQMAREVGLNPRRFGKYTNEKQEAWKKPLSVFIEEIYLKRFGRRRPDLVRSIEQLVQDRRKRKAERKLRKSKPRGQEVDN